MAEDEQPRPVLFHWIANMVFAGIALGLGVLFGMELPAGGTPLAVAGVAVVGLLMIPLSRRWDRDGIQKRKTGQGGTSENPEGLERKP